MRGETACQPNSIDTSVGSSNDLSMERRSNALTKNFVGGCDLCISALRYVCLSTSKVLAAPRSIDPRIAWRTRFPC
jgi:hypothetical protein